MKTSFISDSPSYKHLVEQWHPTKNGGLTPANVMPGSGKTIWWVCSEDSSHEWDAMPMARTAQSQGCPFCSGKRVLAGYNDLATTNPDLASQWHHTLNKEFSIQEVSASSNKKAWWICPAGEDHVWEATINSRNVGNKCPYCTNRKILSGFNDLASNAEHEHVVKEWHPRNTISPTEVSVASNKKVWWICENNHEWEALIANRTTKGSGCKACKKSSTSKPKTITVSESEFASEWHPENDKLSTEVTSGSAYLAKWICSVDSSHVWESKVSNRFRGSGCLICSARKIVPGVNDLASYPEYAHLVEEWHPDNEMLPSEVSTKNMNSVKWICKIGHIWVCPVFARTRNGSNCPECAGRETWLEKKRVVADYPELMKQWHASNTLDPEKITFRSAQKSIWQCSTNDKHIWEASVSSRSLDGTDCPACAGRVIIVGVNDLASSKDHTSLVKQWHPDNKFGPETVTLGSNIKAKWQCDKNKDHVWEAPVYSRTKANPQGCPQCAAASQVSKGERELLEVLQAFGFNPKTSHRQAIIGRELDLFIPEKNFAIEFNGLYWHSESVRSDTGYHAKKLASCNTQGIDLFNVWEDDWRLRKDIIVRELAKHLDVIEKVKDALPGSPVAWSEVANATDTVESVMIDRIANKFLEENHIQGASDSDYFFGLSDGSGEIFAVLAITRTSADTFKIDRYAELGKVNGGLNKLMEFAENHLDISKWSAVVDLSMDDGSLYKSSGFVADKNFSPDFTYLVGSKRVSKDDYTVGRFKNDRFLNYVDGMGVTELADLNALHRIWDFGKTRYVKDVEAK